MRRDPKAMIARNDRQLAEAIACVDAFTRGGPLRGGARWVVAESLDRPEGSPVRYWPCRLRTLAALSRDGRSRAVYMPLFCRPEATP